MTATEIKFTFIQTRQAARAWNGMASMQAVVCNWCMFGVLALTHACLHVHVRLLCMSNIDHYATARQLIILGPVGATNPVQILRFESVEICSFV